MIDLILYWFFSVCRFVVFGGCRVRLLNSGGDRVGGLVLLLVVFRFVSNAEVEVVKHFLLFSLGEGRVVLFRVELSLSDFDLIILLTH